MRVFGIGLLVAFVCGGCAIQSANIADGDEAPAAGVASTAAPIAPPSNRKASFERPLASGGGGDDNGSAGAGGSGAQSGQGPHEHPDPAPWMVPSAPGIQPGAGGAHPDPAPWDGDPLPPPVAQP